ncbi:MAG: hypothetical protein U0935_09750 [Pirellulales bacterium]
MCRHPVSSSFPRAVRLGALLLASGFTLIAAEPAAAQKSQFDRRKPHVNVSGAAIASPDTFLDAAASSPTSSRGGGGDIIVFDVIDSVVDTKSTSVALTGGWLWLLDDLQPGLNEALVVSDDGFARCLVEVVEPGDDAANTMVLGVSILLVAGDLTTDPAEVASGYIRVKKLNTGG